jgi:hypothetical protein
MAMPGFTAEVAIESRPRRPYGARGETTGHVHASAVVPQRAPGSGYDGQECSGNTLWDVYYEQDGLETKFYYIAVGSC